MNRKNVLVFPSGTEIANEIINALKNHKVYRLVFASSADIDYSSFLPNNRHYLPYVDNELFLDKLNTLIKKENIDYIIPAHDDAAYHLSRLENSINSQVIGQSFAINEVVRFKDKTYETLQGVVPIAQIFDKKLPQESDFPVFVKPKKGQGSFDSVKLNNLAEFSSFFNTRTLHNYVVMECLIGEEFTIDCFSEKGRLVYCGARTREKVTKGISVLSSLVTDAPLKQRFREHATRISEFFGMHGLWFFQMKFNRDGELRLLEIAPRVSGTMMLNRVLGVNFVELAILQKQGYENLSVAYNDIELSLARALVPIYKHNIVYKNLYIDFDDTLFLDEQKINTDLMKLIFDAKNKKVNIYLITKNSKNNLAKTLNNFGISNIFDDIYHLSTNDDKTKFMKENSILIDDSFNERKNAIEKGFPSFSVDNFYILLD